MVFAQGTSHPAFTPLSLDPDDMTNWTSTIHDYWTTQPRRGKIEETVHDGPPPLLYCVCDPNIQPHTYMLILLQKISAQCSWLSLHAHLVESSSLSFEKKMRSSMPLNSLSNISYEQAIFPRRRSSEKSSLESLTQRKCRSWLASSV